ncbi:MAG: sulfotransferase family 2 domain-containing protein [Planctomycetota bacterium]
MSRLKRILRGHAGKKATKARILNEAVNFEKRCIFIAVPKTGTMSVRVQLRQDGVPLIPNPHLSIMQVRDSLYTFLLFQSLGKNRSFPSASVPSDESIRQEAERVFSEFFKFSAVRNPWARAVSLYSRRAAVQTKDEMSFEAFCAEHVYASDTCLHPTLFRNQFDWLCDEDGVCVMDYVYRLEDFSRAVQDIAEMTDGRVVLERRVANRNPDSGSEAYRDLYNDDTRRLIAQRFEKDIDYFKYTF